MHMPSNETAIVTGGTGFIGSKLVSTLVQRGVKTYCLIRRSSLTKCHPILTGANIIPVESFETEELTAVLRGLKATVVFHLAFAGVIPGRESPEQIVDVNVRLMANLLAAIERAQLSLRCFLNAGSWSEYGISPNFNCRSERLTEEIPLLPSSVYVASKAAAFLCGRAISLRTGVPFISLRLFNTYGPCEAAQRLIPFIAEKFLQRESVSLTGGQQARDFLFVDDVVEAFWEASRLGSPPTPVVYNVCSSAPVKVREIGLLVATELQSSAELLQWGAIPYRSDEPMYVVGDNRGFLEATSWSPRCSLSEGVRRTLAWLGNKVLAHAA